MLAEGQRKGMLKTEEALDWREEFWGMDERVFLDCANQGPFPRATIRAVEQALELKKYPERLTAEHYFELPQQARTGLAKLIGARPSEIALTNGAADGINAVANGLEWKAGDEIVLPAREFPSNYFLGNTWKSAACGCGRWSRPTGALWPPTTWWQR